VTVRRPLFVVNPTAGGGRAARLIDSIRQAVNSHGGDVVCTQRRGHAEDLARQAASEGFDAVVGVGGDGTLNEIANGLLAADTPVPLGAIPAGTGNDFVRSLGLPSDPLAALRVVWSGAEREIDLGQCGQRPRHGYSERVFLNAAGVGFDARVARTVQGFPKLLKVGTAPYVLGVLLELLRKTVHPIQLELDDQHCVERRMLMVAVANGAFYGGGMKICPEASRDDGLLDVCAVGDMPRREVLRLLPKVFSGGHVGHPMVEFFRTRELKIACAAGSEIQLDGELVGRLPAVLRAAPRALRVLGPLTNG